MRKIDIPQERMTALVKSMEERLHISVVYRSEALLHVKGYSHNFGWVRVYRDDILSDSDYGILLECNPLDGSIKFVHSGYYFINHMLCQKFGGSTVNGDWILYNEPYEKLKMGYKGEKLPAAQEIINFIEDLYDQETKD